MVKKIPVTVNNLKCQLVYDLYRDIVDDTYLVDCHESKADEYLRCLELLLSEPHNCIDLDCLDCGIDLYQIPQPCNDFPPITITCNLEVEVEIVDETLACNEPIVVIVNIL